MQPTSSPRFTEARATESNTTAVAWPAIIAGAVAAAAMSLILLMLGTGLGPTTSVSPWSHTGVTAATFTLSAAIWLIVMQWAASGLGGYLTGRLRSKWVSMHTDEVFFRDTAHGFLAWALATIMTAALLASATSSVIGGSAKAATAISAGAAAGAANGSAHGLADANMYFVDSLFRSSHGNTPASDNDMHREAGVILMRAAKDESISEDDKAYLAQVVAARAGVSQQEASQRIDNVMSQMQAEKEKMKAEADEARKTASKAAFFTFLSLLIGAFIASVTAALGGRQRDEFLTVQHS